jgi:hypothetical protein
LGSAACLGITRLISAPTLDVRLIHGWIAMAFNLNNNLSTVLREELLVFSHQSADQQELKHFDSVFGTGHTAKTALP